MLWEVPACLVLKKDFYNVYISITRMGTFLNPRKVCSLLIVLVQMGKLDEFSLTSSLTHLIPEAGTSSFWGLHITLLSGLTPEVCNLK